MKHKDSQIKNELYLKITVFFLLVLMGVIALVNIDLFSYEKDETMIRHTMIRFIGGLIMILIMVSSGYRSLFKFKNIGKSLLIILPALLISINNFPIIAYIDQRAFLTEPAYRVFLFLVECLSVGFFEEIIFRGFLLMFLIKALSHMKNKIILSIFISSALFGLIHLLNLFSGASIGDTLLQVGYSFLVGMLWAVLFLKTNNLWLIMILHALYNFFGQVMFYLGSVYGRYDVYTIVITTLLAFLVAVYAYRIYENLPDQMIDQKN